MESRIIANANEEEFFRTRNFHDDENEILLKLLIKFKVRRITQFNHIYVTPLQLRRSFDKLEPLWLINMEICICQTDNIREFWLVLYRDFHRII